GRASTTTSSPGKETRASPGCRRRTSSASTAREDPGCRTLVPGLLRDVHDAEPIALRIRQDDVVGVRRSLVPVNLGGAQRDQAFDLSRLVFGVQVQVDARGHLHRGANPVQGEVRPDAVSRTEEHEVIAVARPVDVVECCFPELGLALQVVQAQDDRTDAKHPATVHRYTRTVSRGAWSDRAERPAGRGAREEGATRAVLPARELATLRT